LTRGELDTLTADVANVLTISALDDKDGRRRTLLDRALHQLAVAVILGDL